MDLWVVVAASAGCLAKYVQNLSRVGNSLPELSPGDQNYGKPKFPDCSSHRFAHIKKLGDHISKERKGVSDGRLSDVYRVDGALAAELASTSGSDVERLGCIDIHEDRNALSVSNISPRCPTNDDMEHEARNRSSGDIDDNSAYPLRVPYAGIGYFHGSWRNRSSLHTKRSYGHFFKPLSSWGSSLVARLCKEHSGMENYIFRSLPSPSTQSMGPLFVTDGSGILSIANTDFLNAQTGFKEDKVLGEACFVKNENMYGIPLLPTTRSLEFLTKMKKTRACGSGRFLTKMVGGKHTHACSQEGSPDGIIIFNLGIYIGIIFSIITNKREVDNLKELLKQAQNFVQDLQDELEWKDSMVVKELDYENYKSQNASDNSYDMALTTVSTEPHTEGSTKYADNKIYDWTVEESSEPMSKIEAELEAELEMLELNIKASSLDRRLSDLVELDSDFVADFAQGELRADMINDRTAKPKSNEDARDTSTPHSGNYAVSPRELSLRLHEVIQSRLEDRVLELETALQNNQRKLNLMESGPANSWKELSSFERVYSSVRESSLAQKYNPLAQLLF